MATGDHGSSLDALLCDLDMPKIGCQDLIGHFLLRYPSVPIILPSGSSDFEKNEKLIVISGSPT